MILVGESTRMTPLISSGLAETVVVTGGAGCAMGMGGELRGRDWLVRIEGGGLALALIDFEEVL